MADNVYGRRLGSAEEMAQAPVFLLDPAVVDLLGKQFGDRGEHGKLPVQVFHLQGDLIRREHSDDAAVIDDRDTEKGQFGTVQVASGAGPIQKLGGLSEIRTGHRPAGLRDLARNPFPGAIGDVQALDVHTVCHIQPGGPCFTIDQRDHSPLHPQTVAHLLQGLLDLIPKFPRLRQDPGDGVECGKLFEAMDANLFSPRHTDMRRLPN